MKQRPRIYYTEAQKALMWERWKAGDTLHEIGKLFDRPHTSIHSILSTTGGIRPAARHRSRLALTIEYSQQIHQAFASLIHHGAVVQINLKLSSPGPQTQLCHGDRLRAA